MTYHSPDVRNARKPVDMDADRWHRWLASRPVQAKPTTEMRAALKELMERYDITRAAWLAEFGTDQGFDAWFTAQVLDRR
jgi:hypothetical protein